jgi:predicted TIM-barrel fold metal-dependent hydrolase
MPLLYQELWITSASVQRQSTLESTIREVGIDRMLFSIDYPYEDMLEIAQWFDGLETDNTTRAKIAYGNAKMLLRIE